jgi:hypothetical protein
MCPVGDVVLHDAGDAGGARRVQEVVLAGKVENATVGVEHALLQKHEGVERIRGLNSLRESFGQRLHGDLGGDLAVVVTAHAVGDDHQQGFARIAVGQPVFVVGTLAGPGLSW